MRKAGISVIIIFLISSLSYAQDLSIQDVRDMDWRMKVDKWMKLGKIQDRSNDLLDQEDFDVTYAELDIEITSFMDHLITGAVTMTCRSLVDGMNTVEYNFHTDLIVDSVKAGGQLTTFDHSDHILTINLDRTYDTGEEATTIVYYNGTPPYTGFGSFSWRLHLGAPVISTMSCPEEAYTWWPCKDTQTDKIDSADVVMTVGDSLIATSNGVMVSDVNNGNGTRTFTWHISYPIATYLICMTISNYQSWTDWYVSPEGDSIPITNYVYPEHYDDAVADLSFTPEIMEIYVDLFGDYPFAEEKYGHSIFPFAGGMEHQNNCSFGSILITGNGTYESIVVHELAHQWFGDMITCHQWADVWMNEGFATYCEALYYEQVDGLEAYLYYMTHDNRVREPSGPIYDPSYLWSSNTVYNKGSWVLHMLRGVMGDEDFFDGMYAYANNPDYQYKTITTRQFQHQMEQFYGGPLDWFIDEWVWGRNRPHYEYSWLAEDIGGGEYEIFLHIDQTQEEPSPRVFKMPVKVYVDIEGDEYMTTVWNDSREDDFRFIVSGNPESLEIDRYDWILKTSVETEYGFNIVTTSLEDGAPGEYYEDNIESRGGTAPYAYEVIAGALPDGLQLESSTGRLYGTPADEGYYDFTVLSTDSSEPPMEDEQEYRLRIGDPVYVDEDEPLPNGVTLYGNYPNPFNSSTTIKFDMPQSEYIKIEIFNIMGQLVDTAFEGNVEAGANEVVYNNQSLASGLYFYRLCAEKYSAVRRMTLLK
ncbi:MAG: T9SS type A sorting domain-containing protein [candidate division Zixibacteria bacterium]|nr:T9SS type A sorting domain-containing protein [candidate division Zixibacteria bacterium]